MSDATWGRVEADGTVYARDAAGTEKLVGQYPDGTPEEALAFFNANSTTQMLRCHC